MKKSAHGTDEEVRGFAFYVLDAGSSDPERCQTAAELRDLVSRLLPSADTLTQRVSAAQSQMHAEIDLARDRLVVNGTALSLSYQEIAFVRLLVLRGGIPMTRAEIVDALPGRPRPPGSDDRFLNFLVWRLRRKLGPFDAIIQTVRGSGYRFEPRADLTVIVE